jgi:hypothetical protein
MKNINRAFEILLEMKKSSLSINDRMVFQMFPDKVDTIKNYLQENNIVINELLSNTEIELDKSFYEQYDIQPYNNFASFFRRFDISNLEKKTVLILGENSDEMVIFCKEGKAISYCYPSGKQDLIAANFYYAKQIVETFLPKVADYRDTAHNKFIFLSPEYGRFEIVETNLTEIAEIKKPLSKTYEDIYDIISHNNRGWEYVLKNRIIRSLETLDSPEKHFYWLIESLDRFIDATNKDYEVYLTSFRHEKLIEQYEKEKDAFADKIRGVLERISTNLLSIPITFSAALFGFKEINDEWLIGFFLFSLIIFVVFSCLIQGSFICELSTIRKEILSKLDYFSRGLRLLEDKFKSISNPQLRKINFLQVITFLIIVFFILLYLLLVNKYINSFSSFFNWIGGMLNGKTE